MDAVSSAISHLFALLLGGARWASSFGVVAAGVVGAFGLALMIVGHRAFRPAAAVIAAAGAALLGHLVIAELALKLPVTEPFALTGAAVAGAALALAFPAVGTALASAAVGLWAGRLAAASFPADRDVVLLGSFCVGGVVAGVFWTELPTFVPPVAGACLAALGGWSADLATRAVPQVAELPAVWVGVAGVLAVLGAGLERTRAARREKSAAKKQAQSEAEAKQRRDAEMRERYARYFQ